MLKMVAQEELEMAIAKRAYDNRDEYRIWFGEFYEMHHPPEGHLGTADAIRIAREYLRKKGRL